MEQGVEEVNWLIGHLVGDYLLQNDWQALNKKQSSYHCAVHVSFYIMAVFVFTQWPWWALLITAVCHFVQDRTGVIRWYMRIMGQEKFATGPCSPWSIIVVDNVFHLVQLYLTSLAVEYVK